MTHALLIYTEHIYCTLPVLKLHEFRVLYCLCTNLFTININCQMFLITILYQTTLFICMILGIELTYIDTELIHHVAIAV